MFQPIAITIRTTALCIAGVCGVAEVTHCLITTKEHKIKKSALVGLKYLTVCGAVIGIGSIGKIGGGIIR